MMEIIIYAILTAAACVVAAVILLALFFKILEYRRKEKKPPLRQKFQIAGVVDENTLLNIHLRSGKTFEKVRCIGYTHEPHHGYPWFDEPSGPNADALPPEFSDVMILEDTAGLRFLSPTRMVNLIEILPGR